MVGTTEMGVIREAFLPPASDSSHNGRGRADCTDVPSKIWVSGFDVNNDSALFDFGVPQLDRVDIRPDRWTYSTGGSDPQDTVDAGVIELKAEEEGLRFQKVDMRGTDTIRHLEPFSGDFHFQMEMSLPTMDESGGYRTRSGVGANIEFAFRPQPSQTAGARYSIHLTEERQTKSLSLRREGDLIHLSVDGKRVGGYRFPGSEHPGHLFVTIGGVGFVKLQRLERVIPGQPAIGASLAANDPAPAEQTRMPKAGSPVKTTGAAPWRNLMAGVDLSTHTLRGRGRVAGGLIETQSEKAPSLFRTLVRAPRRYELRASVTRKAGKGAFYLLCPIEGRDVAVIVEAENDGQLSSGLALIDRTAPKNPAYPARACVDPLLPLGKRVEIVCRVDGREFQLLVGDKRVFRWHGDPGRLSLTPFFRNSFSNHVLFGSARSRFLIHQLELRSLDPPAPAVADPDPSERSATASTRQPSSAAPAEKSPPKEPVVAMDGWFVPATSNASQDERIKRDLAFARDGQGMQLSKTKSSGKFWLYREPILEGDFIATIRATIPPDSRGQITLGAHAVNRQGQIFMTVLPRPLQKDARETVVRIQRVGRELVAQVDGRNTGPPGNMAGPIRLALLLRDDVRLTVDEIQVQSLGHPATGESGDSGGAIEGKLQEIKLPAPVDSATLGGGGRFLIMHIKPIFKLAVFDVEKLELVQLIPVHDSRVLFAAGEEKLVVVQPEQGTIERWSLGAWQRERAAEFHPTATPTDLAMGHASAGPLLLTVDTEGTNKSDVVFYDLDTLQPQEVKIRSESNTDPRWYSVFAARASADGRLFAVCSSRSCRLLTYRRRGASESQLYENDSRQVRFAMPGPLGEIVYTDAGLFNAQFKPLKQDGVSRLQPVVPATRGPFYLTVDAPASYTVGDTLRGTVSLQLAPYVTPLATFPDLKLKGARSGYFSRDNELTLDRRLILHVPSGRIVAIADEADRLLVTSTMPPTESRPTPRRSGPRA